MTPAANGISSNRVRSVSFRSTTNRCQGKAREIQRESKAFRGPLEWLESRLLPTTLFGLTEPNNLIQFDSSAPGTLTNTVAIAPLAAGENVVGIDFRPAT